MLTTAPLVTSLTLIDFENNSPEKNHWSVETNKYIDINEKTKAIYTPTDKSSDVSNLTFIFSDDERFYYYKVKGTYRKTSSFTAFVETSVKIIE